MERETRGALVELAVALGLAEGRGHRVAVDHDEVRVAQRVAELGEVATGRGELPAPHVALGVAGLDGLPHLRHGAVLEARVLVVLALPDLTEVQPESARDAGDHAGAAAAGAEDRVGALALEVCGRVEDHAGGVLPG